MKTLISIGLVVAILLAGSVALPCVLGRAEATQMFRSTKLEISAKCTATEQSDSDAYGRIAYCLGKETETGANVQDFGVEASQPGWPPTESGKSGTATFAMKFRSYLAFLAKTKMPGSTIRNNRASTTMVTPISGGKCAHYKCSRTRGELVAFSINFDATEHSRFLAMLADAANVE
ncbi:hypothetical protein [Rhizobium sp. IBUN]|uniref:hypothetical protein n=1 Tax=Rhizobium sp. IBUN TaxID=1042326 RepID=UPI00047082EC|nr:hypothetical protein [Rhizobium sp. IBUN]